MPGTVVGPGRRVGEKMESREGKNVYRGVATHLHPGGDEATPVVPVVFEVTERLYAPDGTRLLIPEIEVDTYWTNLPCGADEVIGLYHAHGTSEQFHSELKTDMDVERLPSGKLCVNKTARESWSGTPAGWSCSSERSAPGTR